MRRIIKHVSHHAKKHGKAAHKHVKKHHQKYIFGAISGALVYKTLALILTTAAINPMGITFASGTVDTGTAYTGTVMAGDFFVNNDDSSTTGLDVTINNNIDGATHMRFGNTESERNIAAWDMYSDTQTWILDDNGTGTKSVYAQFSGNNSSGENIILDLQDDIDYLPEIEETEEPETNSGTTNSGFITDTTPNTVILTDIINANLTTEYFSNTVEINGINTGAEISISSNNLLNNGAYKINSDSRTSTSGVVNSGDTVQVKLFSSDENSTENILTLSVGDLDIDWSITTTGSTQVDSGVNEEPETNTGTVNTGTESTSNQICDSQDIELLSPLSGDIVKGEFDIIREYKNTDCDSDSMTIKLRDANTQYVELGTVDYNDTNNSELSFDSSMLYSGFYNIYSGVDLSGNNILIHTGQYSGNNIKFNRGHKLAVLNSNNDIMYEGNEFTIDNIAPSVTVIELTNSNENKRNLGVNDTVNILFGSKEELTGVVTNILGMAATLESHTLTTIGSHKYAYTIDLGEENTEGNIIYNIAFSDLAGNTGYAEGYESNFVFDKTNPVLNNISFINRGDAIDLDINISEDSEISFIYNLSGSNTGGLFEDTYSSTHDFSFTGISLDLDYNYTLSLEDYAKNITYIGGVFKISGDVITHTNEVINSEDMIVDTGFSTGENVTTETETGSVNTGATSTGSISAPATTFLGEINKFKQCKDSLLNITTLEIPVRSHKAKIEMPELETTYVRKLVSAFSIVLFDRIEKGGLAHDEIDEITKEFNNFLVIIKLVRDDSNDCEQNLSNYYMSKFRDSLVEYSLVE